MTAIAPVSSDITIGRVAAIPATTALAVRPSGATAPDKNHSASDKPAAIDDVASATVLLPRTVTLSDVTTGLLIQTDQDPRTGETVSQFPDHALLESYAQQIRLQDANPPGPSLNT